MMPAMDADKWNSKYPPGWPVIVTLADGKRIPSTTRSAAYRVGQFDMVEVECITHGGIPLTWCWPMKSPAPKASSELIANGQGLGSVPECGATVGAGGHPRSSGPKE